MFLVCVEAFAAGLPDDRRGGTELPEADGAVLRAGEAWRVGWRCGERLPAMRG